MLLKVWIAFAGFFLHSGKSYSVSCLLTVCFLKVFPIPLTSAYRLSIPRFLYAMSFIFTNTLIQFECIVSDILYHQIYTVTSKIYLGCNWHILVDLSAVLPWSSHLWLFTTVTCTQSLETASKEAPMQILIACLQHTYNIQRCCVYSQ